MSFNSIQFFVLLAVVLGLYWRSSRRSQNLILLVASAVFYGWWDPRFLLLIWFSVGLDFTVSNQMDRRTDPTVRRRLLYLSILGNLGVLGFFKYAGFFVDSANGALERLGLGVSSPLVEVLLPVGISFYTFQTLAYTVDVYRGRIEPERSLLDFAVFVTYFPQLVAGPIERAERLLPQVRRRRERPTSEQVVGGLGLIGLGLFRKVVIADGVAGVVNDVYAEPAGSSSAGLVLAAVAFALQIYGDFAGYTDIARGTSRLLGIELMRNFREPYLSRNITEFWRRWHISLSEWLRDYLYIPLGGNRRGGRRTQINLMATMVLGGLWHGAGWGFILWGALHGVALVVHRQISARPGADAVSFEHPLRFRQLASIVATFGFFAFTLVPFRIGLSGAREFVEGVLTARGGGLEMSDLATVVAALVATIAVDIARRGALRPSTVRPEFVGASAGMLLVLLVVFSGGAPTPFIYFQF